MQYISNIHIIHTYMHIHAPRIASPSSGFWEQERKMRQGGLEQRALFRKPPSGTQNSGTGTAEQPEQRAPTTGPQGAAALFLFRF